MPTLTQTKRIAHPAKFARKDARTRVYRALYGSPSHPDSHGGPSANISRKLSEDWSYNQAESSFASLAQREVAREGKRVVEFEWSARAADLHSARPSPRSAQERQATRNARPRERGGLALCTLRPASA